MTRKIKDENLRKRTTRRKSGKSGKIAGETNVPHFYRGPFKMRSNRTTTTTTLKRKKKAKAAVADAITFPGRENRNNSSQVKKLKKWAPTTCYV